MAIRRLSRTEEVEGLLLSKLDELAGPDGRLPTEAEIAEMFNVSRTTVRSAVGALVARGLVVRRQGLGSFVSQIARITNPLDQALDFVEIVERNCCRPAISFLSTKLVTMDATLAERLRQPDGQALQRHTLFSADGLPAIYCVNTIPLNVLPQDVIPQILENPAISEPIYKFLADVCGQWVNLSRAAIWSDIARNCAVDHKVLPPATPVLVIEEIGHNTASQPVLHSLEYYPGRLMRFELVRWRNPGYEKTV